MKTEHRIQSRLGRGAVGILLLGILLLLNFLIRLIFQVKPFTGARDAVAGPAFYKQLAVAGFLVLALVSYRIWRRIPRLAVAVISIAVLGIWLKTVPGMGEMTRLFNPSSCSNPLILTGAGVIILSALLWGRIYCGYICPAGTLFEIIGKSGPGISPGKKAYTILRTCKYILFLISFTCISAGYSRITDVEPFGLFTVIRTGSLIVWFALIVFLLSAFIGGRIWCIYLCPVGALLGICSAYCVFPKKKMCKGCAVLKSGRHFESECLRCQKNS